MDLSNGSKGTVFPTRVGIAHSVGIMRLSSPIPTHPGITRPTHWRQIIDILRPYTYLSEVLLYTRLHYWRRLMVSHNTLKKGDTMQQHTAHECDDHDHHVDDHSHASHECDDHEHHTHAA